MPTTLDTFDIDSAIHTQISTLPRPSFIWLSYLPAPVQDFLCNVSIYVSLDSASLVIYINAYISQGHILTLIVRDGAPSLNKQVVLSSMTT